MFKVDPAQSVEMKQDMRSWKAKFQCISDVDKRVGKLVSKNGNMGAM